MEIPAWVSLDNNRENMAKKSERKPHLSEKPLTPLQEAFKLYYVAQGLKRGGLAAKRAGYKGSPATLAVRASKNLKLPHVRKAIMDEFDAVRVQAHDVMLELSQLAQSDLAEFFEIDEKGNLLLDYEALKSGGNVLKSIKQGKHGLTIQLHDKAIPLRLLSQHLGIIKQGEGVSVDVHLESTQGVPFTDEQLRDQAKAILIMLEEQDQDADNS